MNFIYENININYEVIGKAEPIIILHGWGRSLDDFLDIAGVLSEKYQVYIIDLPGFGKSDIPRESYVLDDYVLFLKKFIDSKNISNPIIIGHSFGGRIAIRYASIYKVNKLILISSAGIKRFSIKVKSKVLIYKIKKWYFRTLNKVSSYEKLISSSGSKDYLSASVIMKKTLINVVSIDQRTELKEITTETLLMWGKYDTSTPYKDGLLMNKKIKNSGIVTFNTGHFPFLEEPYVFKQVIKNYLGIGDN